MSQGWKISNSMIGMYFSYQPLAEQILGQQWCLDPHTQCQPHHHPPRLLRRCLLLHWLAHWQSLGNWHLESLFVSCHCAFLHRLPQAPWENVSMWHRTLWLSLYLECCKMNCMGHAPKLCPVGIDSNPHLFCVWNNSSDEGIHVRCIVPHECDHLVRVRETACIKNKWYLPFLGYQICQECPKLHLQGFLWCGAQAAHGNRWDFPLLEVRGMK